MPVGEMLRRMSSAELTRWMAYEQITGPLGGQRDDQLVALLASVIANANRGKGGRKAKPTDFLPDWDHDRGTSWEEQLAAVRDANRALGGVEEIRDADGHTTRVVSHEPEQPSIRRQRR
ncbi:phage tail assembly protein T [Nocardiopsis lucentensis]|uniref:phage tail assembly protein T n=1 Tax=Nocardiopsis lucentensis TaxID=53441 RepID=UPI000346AE68|nr:hypothetical protein [Nocardiopsis lucentensis]